MKNYVQTGRVITVTAPSGGIASGAGFLIGSLFGIASKAAAEGETVAMETVGVYSLPKASGALSQGAKVYWDNAAKNITSTTSGNSLVGVAATAAASGDALVEVRLNGVSV